MTPRKHAELIKAWADGAEIQFLGLREWSDIYKVVDSITTDTTAPLQEGHAAGPACSAPDEELIEEIAREECVGFLLGERPTVALICKWAIREYIRRSAGKE